MPAPSLTYTLSNGSVADASQVMQNFNDIINGITDGTKDLSINAITLAGTLTANGTVNLGNSSADDLSITASLASSIAIKTNNSYDIGSATLGLRKLYLGNGGAGATCDIVAASHATTREYTIPDCSAAASFVMTHGTQTVSGSLTLDGTANKIKGTSGGSLPASTYVGEKIEGLASAISAGTTGNYKSITSVALTAGNWLISANASLEAQNTTTFAANTNQVLMIGATLDSGTGIDAGNNSSYLGYLDAGAPGAGVMVGNMSVSGYVVTISSNTTYYLNALAQYTNTAPKWYGRLTAVRIP